MSSWQLLRRLIGFWDAVDNPIFLREITRPPVWQSVTSWLGRATGLTLTLGGLGCYFSTLLMFYLNSVLVILTPVLLGWTLLIGLTLAPSVVQERQHRTWETLRVVPLSMDMIVLGKAGGALWWVRNLIRIMSGVLLLVAVGIGLVSLVLLPNTAADDAGSMSNEAICAATLVMPLVSAGLFIVDRTQQFVLTAIAALSVSASSSNVRVALSGAGTAALIVWMADIGLASLLIVLQPDTSFPPLLTLATLGPVVGYLVELPPGVMLVCAALTLLLREVAVRVLWWWTMRSAGRI